MKPGNLLTLMDINRSIWILKLWIKLDRSYTLAKVSTNILLMR